MVGGVGSGVVGGVRLVVTISVLHLWTDICQFYFILTFGITYCNSLIRSRRSLFDVLPVCKRITISF